MYSFIVQAGQGQSGGSISNGFDLLPWFSLSNSFNLFDNIISVSIAVITIIAGVWFIFLIISGGLSIMTAGENKGAVEEARKRITMGLVGLLVVIVGIFIIDILGKIFGLRILEPGNQLQNLRP